MPVPDDEGILPGWYRDPDDADRHRYWNGSEWLTEDEHAALTERPEDDV